MSVGVTVNPNGGSLDGTTEYYVYYGQAYGAMPTPTKTGYDFAGWYDALSGGAPVTESSICNKTDNHTLYAHWTPSAYTVTFDANGGTTPIATKTVNYDNIYGELPVPSRPGYKFLGWYEEDGEVEIKSSTTVIATENHTLYAHWEVMTVFRRIQNGTMELYPLVYIIENEVPTQAIGLYVVENGTGHQCM